MRIDQALHWLCLVKSRSLAARACREGRVLVDGHPVRASREARCGEEIVLQNPARVKAQVIELSAVPARQINRKDAGDYYTVIRVEELDRQDLNWNRSDGTEDE